MLPLTSKKEIDEQFRRRTRIAIAAVSIIFILLAARIVELQVLRGERFTYLSENNRIRLKKVPGIRGTVFDRRGQLLIHSPPSFDLLLMPEDAE